MQTKTKLHNIEKMIILDGTKVLRKELSDKYNLLSSLGAEMIRESVEKETNKDGKLLKDLILLTKSYLFKFLEKRIKLEPEKLVEIVDLSVEKLGTERQIADTYLKHYFELREEEKNEIISLKQFEVVSKALLDLIENIEMPLALLLENEDSYYSKKLKEIASFGYDKNYDEFANDLGTRSELLFLIVKYCEKTYTLMNKEKLLDYATKLYEKLDKGKTLLEFNNAREIAKTIRKLS